MRRGKSPFCILSTADSKISKQRSTGQNLQCWRISSMPAGQEKGQTQTQMGRSLHNRPSTDWWSVPSTKRIGQPTRAEPMERSTPTKILHLAPDFVFVSFLCPLFFIFFTLAVWHFSPSLYLFSPKPLGACMCIVRTYLTRHPRSSYLGASLSEVYINGPHAQNMRYTSA